MTDQLGPETGAALYRIVRHAPALAMALEALPDDVAAEIGYTAEDRERVSQIFSRAVAWGQAEEKP